MVNGTIPRTNLEFVDGPGESVTAEAAPSTRQFLTFRLAGERFGISIDSIVEILKYRLATPVPRADPTVHGIVSVRGRIITVIDGRLRLGFPGGAVDPASRIIVVHDGDELVGVLVDKVIEVIRLPEDAVAPPPETVCDAAEKGILGVCDTREDSILILLDMNRFLDI